MVVTLSSELTHCIAPIQYLAETTKVLNTLKPINLNHFIKCPPWPICHTNGREGRRTVDDNCPSSKNIRYKYNSRPECLQRKPNNTTLSACANRYANYGTVWHIIDGQGDDSLILEGEGCGLISNLRPWVAEVEGSMWGTSCRTRKGG